MVDIPNDKIPELLTASIEQRLPNYTDMISDENVLLFIMKENDNIIVDDFGPTIRENLLYNETGTYSRFSGYDFVNVKPSDVFTAAEFGMKMASVAVSISGEEILTNSGRNRFFNLLSGKIDAAKIELDNNLNVDMHSDGTLSGGKQIGGMQRIISTTPTLGILAGIDRAKWDFWRNRAYIATSSFPGDTSATSATNIVSRMNRISGKMTKGTKGPNVWMMGYDYFMYYLEAMQAKQMVMSDGKGLAGAGFSALKYFGTGRVGEVVLDGGDDTPMPPKKLYAIDSKAIKLRIHKNRNFSQFGGERTPLNQDANTRLIGFAGNMTTNNPRALAVMTET